jgi:Sec-independent protein translocase protein TatA
MIPQIGFAEMIVLALLAIIVVGPKDLPKLMRTLGAGMAKIRMMANLPVLLTIWAQKKKWPIFAARLKR